MVATPHVSWKRVGPVGQEGVTAHAFWEREPFGRVLGSEPPRLLGNEFASGDGRGRPLLPRRRVASFPKQDAEGGPPRALSDDFAPRKGCAGSSPLVPSGYMVSHTRFGIHLLAPPDDFRCVDVPRFKESFQLGYCGEVNPGPQAS